jgi:hypothetical protein
LSLSLQEENTIVRNRYLQIVNANLHFIIKSLF